VTNLATGNPNLDPNRPENETIKLQFHLEARFSSERSSYAFRGGSFEVLFEVDHRDTSTKGTVTGAPIEDSLPTRRWQNLCCHMLSYVVLRCPTVVLCCPTLSYVRASRMSADDIG
jgi:hypothetical protein